MKEVRIEHFYDGELETGARMANAPFNRMRWYRTVTQTSAVNAAAKGQRHYAAALSHFTPI